MRLEEFYPITLTVFQICWAFLWAGKHLRLRSRRRYAENRIWADKNRRYQLVSYCLFVAQNALCLGSFWSNSEFLFKVHDSNSLRIIGVIIISYATMLYFQSLDHLGRNYSPCFDSHVPLEIVSTGPYKLTRHPMYLAKLLIAIGNFVVSGSLWFLPMLAYLAAETMRTVHHEERYLTTALPTYSDYRKRTASMIPFLF